MDKQRAKNVIKWRAAGLRGDLEAIGHALRGLKVAIANDRPVQIELACAVAACLVGWRRRMPREQWALLALTVTSVVGSELANSALEDVADVVVPKNFNALIGRAKDKSAAAVLARGVGALTLAYIFWGRRSSNKRAN